MKKFTTTLIASLCLMGTAQAQDNSQNYVMKRTVLNTAGTSYVDNIQYYDGLGRPFQSVERAAKLGTQTGSILATLQEYDTMGRESNAWLPISITGSYVAPSTFKSNAPGNYGSDARPYSQSVYESSPLDRLTESYRPGNAWSNKPAKVEYAVNTTASPYNCIRYSVSSADALVNNGNYAKGTLRVTKSMDEDDKVQYTFTDKQGQKLLERAVNGSEYLDTYYVYDDYGCLRFVLQPEYQTTASLDLYAFQYKYDDHNNCIWKKLPGAAYVTYEYDAADRMIYSQDGNQRTSGKWTFYVYDSLGRLTQQGENTGKSVTDSSVYLQNYYDDYVSLRSAVSSNSNNNNNYPDDTSGYSRGFLTGTMTKVLGTDTKLYTAFYYDIEGRVIRKVQENMLGGHDITTTTYSFSCKPLTVNHAHTANGKTARTEVYTYTYDEKDRVSMVKHKLGSTEVTLASYTYDNKGRMATKMLHGSSTNQLTYSYNIRNWLTGISSTKFTQTLGYGSNYNGNISSMNWNANGASHSYTFTYDGVNRMLNATHGTGAYTEKVTLYDKNGNIKGLQRYGNGLIDNLTYTYNGNQVTRVDDATGNTAGFSNGASAANEYTYDNNGNLTKDSNKNISSITYNCLNLPSKVTFSDGSTITYSYAADGTKLRTVHTISGTTTQKDYCNNVVYENGVQKMLLTEEGYVDLSASTPAYYYYLKDHQGNNRVVLSSGGTVVETNHYYPFGGVFASTSVQPYKYNGKELDTKKGLNWYDYGARHYDATLGRWLVVDPLTEKYYGLSPYVYCNNSPIRYIDPTGRAWKPIYNEDDEGNRVYKGYEWIPESDSYNADGTLKAGLYAQAIFFSDNGTFDASKRYNMGSSTAYVYLTDGTIQTFDANTRPSSEDYAMVPEGIYNAKVGKHKNSYTALRMSDINHKSRIELGKVNPRYKDGRTFAEGINIHKPGLNNLTGLTNSGNPVSEGCLLIDRNKWNEFIGIFDTTEQRFNKISVIVSRSLDAPLNYKK